MKGMASVHLKLLICQSVNYHPHALYALGVEEYMGLYRCADSTERNAPLMYMYM